MLQSTKNAPANPGVYIMRNSREEIIYVGKAKNIRKRVASYTPSRPHDPKTTQLIGEAQNIEYIITDNEVEALIFEAKLIWEHKPRYNIALKDSSSYPYIRITLEDDFPRVFITREKKDKRSLYLGPFTDVKSARRTAKLAVEIFRLRGCNTIPWHRCLKHDTKKCSAPCIGNISREKYRMHVEGAISFLRGNIEDVLAELQQAMQEASDAQNFEAAKIYRDEINSVQALSVRQKIEAEREYNEDIIGYMRAGDIYYVQIFNVRRGVLLGRTKHEATSGDEPKKFLADFLKQHYYEAPIPENVILPEEPDDADILKAYFEKIAGKKVGLSVPKSGTKKKLLDLLLKNISHEVGTKYEPELLELKEKLGLGSVPVVIEFFDVSNIMGKWLVGAMVQFRDGAPDKNNYRRFRILSVPGQNDFASMHEIVWRRYSRLVRENKPLPDLVVVDGGKAQLSAAISAMNDAGVDIPLAALAKREEEIYIPLKSGPLRLDKKEPALKLMQRMRDEAHRFAIGYHKFLRRKNSGFVQ
ncbi:UvrABC system protein C [uncultured archaeon]|nr:UvrABC system protein C [uncultured archaeon]